MNKGQLQGEQAELEREEFLRKVERANKLAL